ncbi:MAG: hypothetical protein RQ757_05975 [Pseudomonadales bacterium]|nr:hypothetical protein [Pseudomonadales bacterium]
MSFKLDTFVSNCLALASATDAQQAIRPLLQQAVSAPEDLYAEIGTPQKSQIEKLYVSDQLTLINVIWAPGMTLLPHNHNMWALIGVYCGREDNIFWRRIKDDPQGRIEAAGAKSLGPADVLPLGRNIIHSVTNPTSGFTGAIHIYGGDFFARERSEWEPLDLVERPYDINKNLQLFDR